MTAETSVPSTGQSALASRPKTVCLLGLGPSSKEWMSEMCRKKNLTHVDEVWGINTAHRSLKCDRIWMMDDLHRIAERYPDWANELKMEKTPIFTCRDYPEFPSAVAIPIEDICKSIGDNYMNTTVAYAIAYAIYIEVEVMYIYGCDFFYPNAAITESGLGGASYMLGIAKERGLRFKIPNTSTLLDSHLVRQDSKGQPFRPMYGYDYNPQDEKRKVQLGRGDDHTRKLADTAYRVTDPNNPECMEAFNRAAGLPPGTKPNLSKFSLEGK